MEISRLAKMEEMKNDYMRKFTEDHPFKPSFKKMQESAMSTLLIPDDSSNVYERLHREHSRPQIHRKALVIHSVEKELATHCSFKPKLSARSPFLSPRREKVFEESKKEKTIVQEMDLGSNKKIQISQQNIQSAISASAISDSYVDEETLAKMRQGYLVDDKGVAVNIDVALINDEKVRVFYYNSAEPPRFQFTLPVVSSPANIEKSSAMRVESVIPRAPKLPPWAASDSGTAEAQTTAPKWQGRTPKKVPDESQAKKKPAGGMGDLMAELNKRIGKGGKESFLKKTETKAPGKLAVKGGGGKKKGGGFTDIIDELSYKLAKLRGEVDEEIPQPVEEVVEAKVPVVTPKKTESVPESNIEEPVSEPIEKYKKYETMRKNKLPDGAIRQRMDLDGLSAADIDEFFNPKQQIVEAVVPSVSDKYSKYETMRKNKLPEGAIRQRMELDGLSAKEIESYFNPIL